jgi:hypothetical protein
MTAAEAQPAAPTLLPAARLHGRLDAIENRRLFGWVWDADRPDDRLVVTVRWEGRVVATTIADRPRIDLRRNGIGDGAHSFDVELDDEAFAVRDRLTVMAASPSTGAELALQLPAAAERAAEAAIAAPMSRLLDRLDVLLAAQRRIQLSQKEASDRSSEVADNATRLVSLASELTESNVAAQASQAEIIHRLSEIDVFLLRFDSILANQDRRLKALADQASRPLRRAVLLLTLISSIAAGSAIVSLVMLLSRH